MLRRRSKRASRGTPERSPSARGPSRRAFLRAVAALGSVAGARLARTEESPPAAPAPRIDVRSRGAAGDGRTDDTAAIQRALDEAAGGGTVVLPPGRYLASTVHLPDGVTLRLEREAVLLGHPEDHRYDQPEELPYRTGSDIETSDGRFALVAARNVRGVAIEGEGVIDANRRERGGPKPVAFKLCREVRVAGIRIENSPNYALSFMGCDGVEVENVTIVNSYADGIDPDCCRNVRISGCEVESIDDGICLKASLALGERVPTEHVTIMGCTVRSSSNAIKLGSESSGDFRDVRVKGCTLVYLVAPGEVERIAEGGGIALEMVDGGTLEDVVVEEIEIRDVPTPLFVRLGNRGRQQKPKVPGRLRNVTLRGIRATGASVASSITGLPGARVQGVRLENVEIALLPGPPAGRYAEKLASVPERPDAYPRPRMFGVLPAAGLYCRHAEGLALAALRFTGGASDPRPVLVAEDLRATKIAGLRIESAPQKGPLVWLEQAQGVALEGAQAPAGTELFLRVTGGESEGIELSGARLPRGARAFELGPGVPSDAVRRSPPDA